MNEISDVSKRLVERFWQTMQTSDFRLASELLHDDYQLEWPQSGERILGRENFVQINEKYPSAGPWRFTIRRLVAEGDQVVSEVVVSDGAVIALAITFSTIRDGKILSQVEYWPDPFDAPAWRAHWVERSGK